MGHEGSRVQEEGNCVEGLNPNRMTQNMKLLQLANRLIKADLATNKWEPDMD